jgi:hypothetical protein
MLYYAEDLDISPVDLTIVVRAITPFTWFYIQLTEHPAQLFHTDRVVAPCQDKNCPAGPPPGVDLNNLPDVYHPRCLGHTVYTTYSSSSATVV